MVNLANPFEFGADAPTPDKAVASLRHTSDATVEFECLMDDICEIFAGARKLEQLPGIFDPDAYTPADELAYVELKLRDDPYAADLIDIPEGMWGEFDAPPLFLRQAAGF